ncbi:hypothetical protein FOA43_001014 [Brettanomyces nanus]|uniref:Uncharacterized protein n=1 Tax=Eeniella nana TaxID=13502 RepID=A0A875RWM5_EENNA|nr:uncharacterized protein FOA43_001014 [Brettanomyces nanus]QPG73701.1 hypothetical protein FOA43_001014 [Brettanomyces nanus]
MSDAALGEVIFSSVKPIIRMYMIILTGFFLARTGYLGVATSRAISDLVLLVFMPGLIFDRVVSYISIDDIKTIGVIVLSAVILYVLNAAVAGLIVLFTPVPKTKKYRWVGGAMLAGIMQNVSDLPIAYLQAMSMLTTEQSEKGTAYVIIWLAMYVMAQFNCGLFQLVELDFKYIRSHADDEEEDLDHDQETQNSSSTTRAEKESHQKVSESEGTSSGSEGTKNKSSQPEKPQQMPDASISNIESVSSLSSSDTDPMQQKTQNYSGEKSDHKTLPVPKALHPISRVVSMTDSDMIPVSPTSTLSEAYTLETENSRIHHRRGSSSLDPRSLVRKTTSRASKMFSPTVSHPTVSKIPSARSYNYRDEEMPIDAELDPISLYESDTRSNRTRRSKPESLAEGLIREYSRAEPHNQNTSTMANIVTETQLSHKDIEDVSKKLPLAKRYKVVRYFLFFAANFKKPNSIALVVSLTVALIPWLKALFVNTGSVTVANAPDKQAPLSFILMYADYIGLPCVPIGLLLIGSILGRLEVSQIPPGFWKSILCETIYRLCILPIIGILWVNKLKAIHWLDDPMAMLVTCIEFALPSATVQIYITASCMKPGETECAPMNCLALYIISQYALLVVSLPIVVCYTIKDVIDF